jgi:hypothetical protein
VTLRVRASSIAPDVRFGVAGALADPGVAVLVGEAVVRAEGCLSASPAIPRYLRYADRDAVIVADGVVDCAAFDDCLDEHVRTLGESDAWDDLAGVVIALVAVDRCFRDSGLWPGNIYLAGTDALRLVLKLAGEGTRLRRDPEAVVRELAALELAYLFPVAGKFRSGAYDGQVQYRLNGWGRALGDRLTVGKAAAARAAAYQRAVAQHIDREHQRYASFLSGLDVARQDYGGNKLSGALALPLPVLV